MQECISESKTAKIVTDSKNDKQTIGEIFCEQFLSKNQALI